MTRRLALACLLATSLLQPCLAQAKDSTTVDKKASPPAVAKTGGPAWNQLSKQQQTDLARFQNHWNDIPAERKKLLIEREKQWRSLPPDRREALRNGARNFRELSPEQRARMRASLRAVRQLPDEQQQAIRQQWRNMTPEQRRAWLDLGGPGISPPPP